MSGGRSHLVCAVSRVASLGAQGVQEFMGVGARGCN